MRSARPAAFHGAGSERTSTINLWLLVRLTVFGDSSADVWRKCRSPVHTRHSSGSHRDDGRNEAHCPLRPIPRLALTCCHSGKPLCFSLRSFWEATPAMGTVKGAVRQRRTSRPKSLSERRALAAKNRRWRPRVGSLVSAPSLIRSHKRTFREDVALHCPEQFLLRGARLSCWNPEGKTGWKMDKIETVSP